MQAIDLMQMDRVYGEMRKQQQKLEHLQESMERVYRKLPRDAGNDIVREKMICYVRETDRNKQGYVKLANVLEIAGENYVRTESRITDYAEESGNIMWGLKFGIVKIPEFPILYLR